MPRRWLAPDFFTDEKMKKATVPERLLGAALIANQDDDGRLRGDPNYLRAIAFLYDNYSLDEVREMRDHLTQVNPNIVVYQNASEEYIQLKRYRRYQNPRYYHPSKFPAPPGWPFEEGNNEVATRQQPSSNQTVTRQQLKRRRSVSTGKGEGKDKNLNLDQNKGKGEGPKRHPPPIPTGLSTDKSEILQRLTECFKREWGRVPSERPWEIIPRELTARDKARLRDLAEEISAAGGCSLEYIDQAFREAAGQQKFSISYVRAILLDWLGIKRNRSP